MKPRQPTEAGKKPARKLKSLRIRTLGTDKGEHVKGGPTAVEIKRTSVLSTVQKVYE